ncbi:MAG: hypothetical protein NC332_02965, partial [Firmicutes bacterium]|nr:hypothetical protein [Bacillota bacterium]
MLRLNGQFDINTNVARGDKSMSHRALIFAAIAKGNSVIRNISVCDDVLATAECLRKLGAEIFIDGSAAKVTPISSPCDNVVLDCKNSGTSARLLAGLVAGLGVRAKFVGDESLCKRPMDRVLKPLEKLGAKFATGDGFLFESLGGKLSGTAIRAEVDSAQVKSAVLIAGLFAEGETSYTEKIATRNHTELMLASLNADIVVDGLSVTVRKSDVSPLDIALPADISSVAYQIGAAVMSKRTLTCRNVLLNERRAGFLRVLAGSGVNIRFENVRRVLGETVGDITVGKSDLKPLYASAADVCDAIDEIPLLAAIAFTIEGRHVFCGVSELQYKECNRISAIIHMAKQCGSDAVFDGENLTVISDGNVAKHPAFKSFGDHRIAMCEAVISLVCGGGIIDETPFAVSFPEFSEAFGIRPLKLGLIGSSVALSRSPYLMGYLSERCDVCCSYDTVTLPRDITDAELLNVIDRFDGLNVTMPFKRRVAELLNGASPSVNTVGKNVVPQSTDGYGLVQALENNGVDFYGKSLWIVGAGGAAEECISVLKQYGCKMKIINRTEEKARLLTEKYGLRGDDAPYGVLSFVPECEFEQNIVLPESTKFAFVAAYKGKSGIRNQALRRNIKYVDGLEMLYHQGAKSFSLWTGTPICNDYGGFVKFLEKYKP